jgi:hypothetical protein
LDTVVSGRIEQYFEAFDITDDAVPVLERFLSPPLVTNRGAALCALVVYAGRPGYEADALLLHYQSRDNAGGSEEEFAAIDYLRRLRDRGSAVASRALMLLDSDPYVRALWGDV